MGSGVVEDEMIFCRMNILSFDIEEWFIKKAYFGGHSNHYEAFDRYLGEILDILDDRQFQATFFVVGMMGKEFPDVIKRIHGRGHEVGCHSNLHTWLNKMSRDEMLQDTRQAIDNLEQCIGVKVKSYRAPAFSIGSGNKWAFDVLASCGIESDASIFPANRSFGGFSDFSYQRPVLIETHCGVIKEYPVVMVSALGKKVAYSGGTYFRLFPLWFVDSQISRQDYNICYFHIGDLIPSSRRFMSRDEYEKYFKEPGTLINRCKRHLKSNVRSKTAFERMSRLICSREFVSIAQAQELIDWNNCPRVII
jgi:polysaccharide deacetylase family protein (PEP-CTERM system associated)